MMYGTARPLRAYNFLCFVSLEHYIPQQLGISPPDVTQLHFAHSSWRLVQLNVDGKSDLDNSRNNIPVPARVGQQTQQ